MRHVASVQVLASYGAVRQMPRKDGSVDPASDFAMRWELTPRGAERVAEMAAAMSSTQTLILATDPDREGEAIAWHIQQELQALPLFRPTSCSRYEHLQRHAMQSSSCVHYRAMHYSA